MVPCWLLHSLTPAPKSRLLLGAVTTMDMKSCRQSTLQEMEREDYSVREKQVKLRLSRQETQTLKKTNKITVGLLALVFFFLDLQAKPGFLI